MLQELTLDMAAVARLCSLLEASQVFGKYKNYIPYEPILRFCGIDIEPIIKSNIYHNAVFKKCSKGFKVAFNGIIFDSKFEFSSFLILQSYGINVVKDKKSLKYPTDNFYFDLYLPDYNIFIECLGLSGYSWYQEKTDKKKSIVIQHKLNCWFVSNTSDLKEKICSLLNL